MRPVAASDEGVGVRSEAKAQISLTIPERHEVRISSDGGVAVESLNDPEQHFEIVVLKDTSKIKIVVVQPSPQ